MRFLFLGGGPNNALPYELQRRGHEVHASPETDWFQALLDHRLPEQYAEHAKAYFDRVRPDVVVATKLWHYFHDSPRFAHSPWCVPPALLLHMRRRGARVVYVCYDDPACTPITLSLRLPHCADHWLTTCPGIERLFAGVRASGAQVHRFWLAWDDRTVSRPEDDGTEVAVTGHPYAGPFPAPHYRAGFGTPRRDLVRALMRAGIKVGVWGPKEWLNRDRGGDPRIAPAYRGWIDPSRIHNVHQGARIVLATHLVEGDGYESGRLTQNGPNQCVVHEARPGLRDEFGNAVSWFRPGDVASLLLHVRNVLADPPRQAKMRARLTELVRTRHTWGRRAEQLLAILSA